MITAKVMTDAVAVLPDSTLAEAARVMRAKQVGSVQVVDATGRLVGMLTESDLLRQISLQTDGRHVSWLDVFLAAAPVSLDYSLYHARLVREVMTENPVYVEPEDNVAAVAQKMLRLNVKRLPVVEEGTLLGIVTITDLLGALTQQLAAAR